MPQRTLSSIFASTRTKLALSLFAFIILASVAVSTCAWLRTAAAPQEEPVEITTPVEATPSTTLVQRGPIQTVRFALHDVGILPQEAHAQPGQVTIDMHDLSGGTEGLIVERETGSAPERLAHVHKGQQHGRGKETLELTPGTYQVWDASRPDNRAVLIIEP